MKICLCKYFVFNCMCARLRVTLCLPLCVCVDYCVCRCLYYTCHMCQSVSNMSLCSCHSLDVFRCDVTVRVSLCSCHCTCIHACVTVSLCTLLSVCGDPSLTAVCGDHCSLSLSLCLYIYTPGWPGYLSVRLVPARSLPAFVSR